MLNILLLSMSKVKYYQNLCIYLLTHCTAFLGVIVDNGGSYAISFIIAGMSDHNYDVIKKCNRLMFICFTFYYMQMHYQLGLDFKSANQMITYSEQQLCIDNRNKPEAHLCDGFEAVVLRTILLHVETINIINTIKPDTLQLQTKMI